MGTAEENTIQANRILWTRRNCNQQVSTEINATMGNECTPQHLTKSGLEFLTVCISYLWFCRREEEKQKVIIPAELVDAVECRLSLSVRNSAARPRQILSCGQLCFYSRQRRFEKMHSHSDFSRCALRFIHTYFHKCTGREKTWHKMIELESKRDQKEYEGSNQIVW